MLKRLQFYGERRGEGAVDQEQRSLRFNRDRMELK